MDVAGQETAAPARIGLSELSRFSLATKPWLLDMSARAGGPRLSTAELDVIASRPDATALVIGGLDQQGLETLVLTAGRRFAGLHFWKCPRIADLSPLEDLADLQLAAFYWNQRSTRLWDLSRNPRLRGLQIQDFTKLHALDDLARATSLDELRFGDAVWSSWILASLRPLESLTQLKSLSFDAKRIEDGRVEPIAALQQLTSLAFPSNQFTTRQVAWLRAHLPDSLHSRSVEPLWDFRDPGKPHDNDTLIVGKRKPWLNSEKHARRIQGYVDEFWAMVDEFRRDPGKPPD